MYEQYRDEASVVEVSKTVGNGAQIAYMCAPAGNYVELLEPPEAE